MIRRSTWFLLVLLAALVGLTFYLNNRKARQALQTPTPASSPLFDVEEGQISRLRIEDASGQAVEIVRDENSKWQVKAPREAEADQGKAEAAVTQVGTLQAMSEVQLGPQIVGLDKPSYTITLALKDGTTHKLTIGAVTPIQSGYYVQLDGGRIQIVAKYNIDPLLEWLKEPPYPPTATPTVTPTPSASETPTAAPLPSETPPAPGTPTSPITETATKSP